MVEKVETTEDIVLLFSKETVADLMSHLEALGREDSVQYGLDLIFMGLLQLSAYDITDEWLVEHYPTQIETARSVMEMLLEVHENGKGT